MAANCVFFRPRKNELRNVFSLSKLPITLSGYGDHGNDHLIVWCALGQSNRKIDVYGCHSLRGGLFKDIQGKFEKNWGQTWNFKSIEILQRQQPQA